MENNIWEKNEEIKPYPKLVVFAGRALFNEGSEVRGDVAVV